MTSYEKINDYGINKDDFLLIHIINNFLFETQLLYSKILS